MPIFAKIITNLKEPPFMKNLRILSCLLLTLVVAVTGFTSCEWDTSSDPEHPLYVTYNISAGNVSYSGPDKLLLDIQTWIRANQDIYDKAVNYTTGEASEFEKTDAEAVKKYEQFAPKFKKFIEEEVTASLKAGKYDDAQTGTPATVEAIFFTSASRIQGKDGHLKYEEFKYSYP